MTSRSETYAARVLVCLYFTEVAVFILVAGMSKVHAYDWALLSTKAGVALAVGVIGLVLSVSLLGLQLVGAGPARNKAAALGVLANLLSVVVGLLLLESAVRVVARRTPTGILVGAVSLRSSWPELVDRSRQALGAVSPGGTWDASYFVYDPELGWTVGSNRRSHNGLYFSSVEGIRCDGPNLRMADRGDRVRVALIGDSNAFSFEVPFEDSWGHHLQRLLGDDVQVLNFGVDGYGIDQMYLRYQRDVRPWRPQVILIGFCRHDLRRTLAIYPFVTFGWPGYLVKPRFTIENADLKLLNPRLPTPEEVLSKARIRDLPLIEYDLGYRRAYRYWQLDNSPLSLRLITSMFLQPEVPDSQLSHEIATLNSLLLARLIESVERDRAVPVAVLMHPGSDLVSETFSRAQLPFLDMTECVAAVPADQRLVPSGNHYTGLANQAVARCTAPVVEVALRQVMDPAVAQHGRRTGSD